VRGGDLCTRRRAMTDARTRESLCAAAMQFTRRDAVSNAARYSREPLYALRSAICARDLPARRAPPQCGSGRYVIDHDVDESVVAD
jgi:hypothetical protein